MAAARAEIALKGAVTPQRWKNVEAIYHAVRAMDRVAWPSALDRACGTDRELRREVQSLLQAGLAATHFMRSPALDGEAKKLARESSQCQAGQHLGPYELIAPLGAGGMGEVWRARDTGLKREVAIKLLLPVFSADPDRLKRFRREAEAVAMLNHPNVLVVHAVGADHSRPYLVTELLDGESLREHVKRRVMPPSRALTVAVQIANGLSAAHARGLVHRDLKPENVFITRDGRVKILDFGLAKLSEADSVNDQSLTSTGVILGTPRYMSPEQARGEEADCRSDIFSLGSILYEMLSGRPAFPGETPLEVLISVINGSPREIDGMPASLWKSVARCLEKDRNKRYQSTSDLAFQLELAAEAVSADAAVHSKSGPKPVAAHPSEAEEPVSGWRRRREGEEAARAPAPSKNSGRRAFRIAFMMTAGVALVVASFLLGRMERVEPPTPGPRPPGPENPSPPPPDDPKPVPVPKPPAPEPSPVPNTNPPPSPPAASKQALPVAVTVRSVPSGASVKVDYVRSVAGITPCMLSLTPGKHLLFLTTSIAGFKSVTVREINVVQEGQQITVQLEQASGKLTLESIPSGASVTINGVPHWQTTPTELTLKPGRYKLLFEKGELKAEREFEIPEGAYRMTVTLEKQ